MSTYGDLGGRVPELEEVEATVGMGLNYPFEKTTKLLL